MLLAPKQGCPVLHKPARASSLVTRLFTERPRLCYTRALAVPSSSVLSPLHVSAHSNSMDLLQAQERGVSFPLLSVSTHQSQAIKSTLHSVPEPGRGAQRAHRVSLRPFRAGSGEGPWVALLKRLAEFKNQIMHYPWSLGMPGS